MSYVPYALRKWSTYGLALIIALVVALVGVVIWRAVLYRSAPSYKAVQAVEKLGGYTYITVIDKQDALLDPDCQKPAIYVIQAIDSSGVNHTFAVCTSRKKATIQPPG